MSGATTSTVSLPEALAAIVAVSHRFGLNPEFSAAGGGSSSAKADGVLYVKPSGVPLATLTAEALIGLEMQPLLDLLDAPERPGSSGGTDEVMEVAVRARVEPDDGGRPSVDLLLHALLPHRYVLHTHPTTGHHGQRTDLQQRRSRGRRRAVRRRGALDPIQESGAAPGAMHSRCVA